MNLQYQFIPPRGVFMLVSCQYERKILTGRKEPEVSLVHCDPRLAAGYPCIELSCGSCGA